VLASEETGKLIAAFDSDASPAFYRGLGPVPGDSLSRIVGMLAPDQTLARELEVKSLRYVLLERDAPLARALIRGWADLRLLAQSESHMLWEVPSEASVAPPPRVGPNIIVMTICSLRRDHLELHGYDRPTTPNIGHLASRGTLFENVVSPSPQTLPSNASIFTGVYPATHGAIGSGSLLGEQHPILGEIMQKRDYLTGGFVSSHDLMDSCGLARGFDRYWSLHDRFTVPHIHSFYRRRQDPVTDAAIDWMRKYSESSFFCWIEWSHPHRPYDPPEGYAASVLDGSQTIPYFGDRRRELTSCELEQVINNYDGEIAFADEQVGRVVSALDSLGLMDDTIIVLTADHGEILNERSNYFGNETELYDESIMVPLIVYLPQVEGGGLRIARLVSSLDIMPTVLELLGEQPPAQAEGESLVSLLNGDEQQAAEDLFSQTFPERDEFPPRYAVRAPEHKLIWKETQDGEITKEFYDLGADPGETVNLYSPENQTAARLDTILAAWLGDPGISPVTPPPVRRGKRFRILRRLGYLDGFPQVSRIHIACLSPDPVTATE
jgi:arylsulfatase A-like enzyme